MKYMNYALSSFTSPENDSLNCLRELKLQSLLISLITGIKLTFTLSTEIMESKSLKKISLQLHRDISYPFNPFFTCNSILRLSAVSLECCKSSLNISLSCLTESYSRLDTPADSPEAPAPSRKLAINLSFDYKNIKSLIITKKILKILTNLIFNIDLSSF